MNTCINRFTWKHLCPGIRMSTFTSCYQSKSKMRSRNTQKSRSHQQQQQPHPCIMTSMMFCSEAKNLLCDNSFPASTTNQNVNDFTTRSHNCAQLRLSHEGEYVTLSGWVHYQRGGRFVVLRDVYGLVQLVVPELAPPSLNVEIIKKIPLETVIEVKGIVQARPIDQINHNLLTGQIEVAIDELKIVGSCKSNLPFQMKNNQKGQVNEQLRLTYRYLDLRRQLMQDVLRIRAGFLSKVREFFDIYGFVEVETPTLFKKTPGGAREFVVPTQVEGKYFNLVQSPQQFKQLLMVGGTDRYFQIARCYRDEGTKPDRQPEFTQIDIEASFTTKRHIMDLVENLLLHSWPSIAGRIKTPFPRIKYKDAINLYGTDKPDIRFDMKLNDLTDILKLYEPDSTWFMSRINRDDRCLAFNVPSGSKLLKNNLTGLSREFKKMCKNMSFPGKLIGLETSDDLVGNEHWNGFSQRTRNDIERKLCLNPGDYLWMVFGPKDKSQKILGKVRTEVASCLLNLGVNIYTNQEHKECPSFIWVDHFPLFTPQSDGSSQVCKLESTHHPFTAPKDDELQLLFDRPEKVTGQHFDLVLNGQEVGGGSIRINDAHLQKYVLENILGEDASQMNYFLEALESGCPPHGGIALGLDRLIAIAAAAPSIRDVIAFPKSSDCSDLMSGAPSTITDTDTRNAYHLPPIPSTSSSSSTAPLTTKNKTD